MSSQRKHTHHWGNRLTCLSGLSPKTAFFKVEVKSVLRMISAHILRGPHDGILQILIEQGVRIQSNSNLNISYYLFKVESFSNNMEEWELIAKRC